MINRHSVQVVNSVGVNIIRAVEIARSVSGVRLVRNKIHRSDEGGKS